MPNRIKVRLHVEGYIIFSRTVLLFFKEGSVTLKPDKVINRGSDGYKIRFMIVDSSLSLEFTEVFLEGDFCFDTHYFILHSCIPWEHSLEKVFKKRYKGVCGKKLTLIKKGSLMKKKLRDIVNVGKLLECTLRVTVPGGDQSEILVQFKQEVSGDWIGFEFLAWEDHSSTPISLLIEDLNAPVTVEKLTSLIIKSYTKTKAFSHPPIISVKEIIDGETVAD